MRLWIAITIIPMAIGVVVSENSMDTTDSEVEKTQKFLDLSSKWLMTVVKRESVSGFEKTNDFYLCRQLLRLITVAQDGTAKLMPDLSGLTHGADLYSADPKISEMARNLLKELVRVYKETEIDFDGSFLNGTVARFLSTTDYREKAFLKEEDIELVEKLANESTKQQITETYDKIKSNLDDAVKYIKDNYQTLADDFAAANYSSGYYYTYFQLRMIQHVLLKRMFKVFFTSAIFGEEAESSAARKEAFNDLVHVNFLNLKINGKIQNRIYEALANLNTDEMFSNVVIDLVTDNYYVGFVLYYPLATVPSFLNDIEHQTTKEMIQKKYREVLAMIAPGVESLNKVQEKQAIQFVNFLSLLEYKEHVSNKVEVGLKAMKEYVENPDRSQSALDQLQQTVDKRIHTYVQLLFDYVIAKRLEETKFDLQDFVDYLNMISRDYFITFVIQEFYFCVRGKEEDLIDLKVEMNEAINEIVEMRKEAITYFYAHYHIGNKLKKSGMEAKQSKQHPVNGRAAITTVY